MKICVIGAPSTGKSVFAKNLAAHMSKEGLSCELVQEYASEYIQAVGAPSDAWEQLVISIGQYLAEQWHHTPKNIDTSLLYMNNIHRDGIWTWKTKSNTGERIVWASGNGARKPMRRL